MTEYVFVILSKWRPLWRSLMMSRHRARVGSGSTGVGCGKGRNDTLSVEGPLFVVPRSSLHEAFPTNTSLSWRAAMRPHDPSFHGRDSRKSIRYLFTINCTCGNVFETARTSLMSLIGYARVSTAEGRQWQASTCLPPSSSTGTPPGWAKRSLGEDMPACLWSPSSCHTSRPSVGPTSCSPANTDGKNAELSLTCHFALFRNRPHSLGAGPVVVMLGSSAGRLHRICALRCRPPPRG